MSQILRQSTQVVVRIGPAVAVGDGFTPVTTLDLSTADEAEALKAAGAATTDISGATFAAISGADGWYNLTLTTSHTDTVGTLDIVVNDDSLILPIFARFQVLEEATFDILYAASATGAVPVASIASGAITAAAIATGAIDADAIAADAVAEIADGVWDEDATGHQTGGTFGQAIGDPGADTTTIYQSVVTDAAGANIAADIIDIEGKVDDLETRLGTPSDLGSGATVAANLVDIESQTDDIGVAGAGLTAINLPDQTMNITGDITGNLSGSVGSVSGAVGSVTGNVGGNITGSVGSLAAQAKADVNAEVDSAIETYHLDHLLAVDYDPQSKPGAAGALINEMVESDDQSPGRARFTAGALEQAPTGGSAPTTAQIADAVWEEAIADHSGTAGSTAEQLAAAGSAGDPWATALPGSYTSGQAGKIVGDNLNATVSSRATQTSVDTIDGIVDDILVDTSTTLQGELDGIQADTEDLQSKLGTPSNFGGGATVAANLSDIEAQTDDIGAAGAGLTALASASALSTVDGKIDTIDTNVDAILVDTGTTLQGELDGIQADTEDIQSRLPAALTADGNIKADTLRIGGTLQTGNDVGADVDSILVDTAEIGAAGAGLSAIPWNATWDAQVESEVADALEATIADSIPADGTRPSVKQALYMLTQFMVERSVTSTTVTVKKPDGSTTLFQLTLDDASSPTSITRSS